MLASVTNTYPNGGAGTVPGAPGPDLPRRGGRPRTRVAALVVTCAVVAGGAFAVTEAASGPGTSPAAGITASGPAGQAAVLNGVLADSASVSSPSPASPAATASAQPSPATRRAAVRRLRRALARLRLLGGMHGEFSFRTKNGPRTLAFERGTVTAVSGGAVTVRAADGTTWTWTLTSTSVVREDGTRKTPSALAAGQSVFAGGPVSGSTRDARLIVIRAAASSAG